MRGPRACLLGIAAVACLAASGTVTATVGVAPTATVELLVDPGVAEPGQRVEVVAELRGVADWVDVQVDLHVPSGTDVRPRAVQPRPRLDRDADVRWRICRTEVGQAVVVAQVSWTTAAGDRRTLTSDASLLVVAGAEEPAPRQRCGPGH